MPARKPPYTDQEPGDVCRAPHPTKVNQAYQEGVFRSAAA